LPPEDGQELIDEITEGIVPLNVVVLLFLSVNLTTPDSTEAIQGAKADPAAVKTIENPGTANLETPSQVTLGVPNEPLRVLDTTSPVWIIENN